MSDALGWLSARLFRSLHAKIDHLHEHAIRQEIHMSDLDDSTARLATAYAELADKVGTPTVELAEALARIVALNEELDVLRASAEDTVEREAALVEERNGLLADATENVSKIDQVTSQLRELAEQVSAEEDDEEEQPPAPEPETPPTA